MVEVVRNSVTQANLVVTPIYLKRIKENLNTFVFILYYSRFLQWMKYCEMLWTVYILPDMMQVSNAALGSYEVHNNTIKI